MASAGDILLGVSSAGAISGLTQNRKNPRSPESLVSRDLPPASVVTRERSVCGTWCQWLNFHLLIELKRATDSSEGHLLPFVTTAQEIDFFLMTCSDTTINTLICFLVPPLGSTWPLSRRPTQGHFVELLLCRQS